MSDLRMSGNGTEDTSYALPPWPEWSDAAMNAEHWDAYGTHHIHRPHDENGRASPSNLATPLRFEDPMGHVPLPSSLEPHTWRRLYTIPHMDVCIEDFADPPVIDLATSNTHLLHSEVMRWILAGIMNLYQLGQAHNMELEGEGRDFDIHSHPWKPWHHIYSKNKVAKNRYHKPVVNPHGKYWVRLFYMGCWRRVTVDDYLPLDSKRRPLLPMTESGHEMWPALLTKALLKVASLSWTTDKEILDFSVIACLTGWHAQELDLHEVPSRTIWWLCQKLLLSDTNDVEDRFTGVNDMMVSDLYEILPSAPDSTLYPILEPALTDPSGEVIGSVFLCAVVNTLPAGLSPCVEHPVLFTGAKIDRHGEIRPPTPLWKTFRWKKWALEQGIIKDTPEKFVKSIRMFSSLQNCLPNMNPVASIPSMIDSALLHKDKKGHWKSSVHFQDSHGGVNKKRKPIKHITYEDNNHDTVFPEMWIKFEKIVHCIKRFEVYYTTKSFKHNLKVTDISHIHHHQEKTSAVQKKHRSMEAKSSLTSMRSSIQKGKTDILYLLMDSVACKKLIISLSVLKPGVEIPKRQSHQLEISSAPEENNHDGANSVPPPIMYCILGESYDCQSKEIQNIKFAIKTVATTCHLLQLNEGLTVFRLWIKLPEVYAIRISSQMPFILGNREVIEDTLASESVSWKQYGSNFSSAFNSLSNMNPQSPQHQELLENLHKSFLPPFIPKPSSHIAAKLKRKIRSKFEETLISLLLEKTDDIDTITKFICKWKWLLRRNEFGNVIPVQTKIGDAVQLKSVTIIDSEFKYESEMKILENYEETSSLEEDENRNYPSKCVLPAVSEHKVIIFDQESGIEFLRRMLGNEPELIKYYPFRNDDKNRIFFTDYQGIIHNVTDEWIPLVRFVVNMHSNTFSHCALYLSTTLPQGVIELVNNDTLEHFPRQLGDIEPSYIPTNSDGYTVFAYGRAEGQIAKDHSWNLRFVSAAQEALQLPHACSWITTNECLPQQPPELTIKEVRGNYLPNKDNIIFKCTLTLQKTQNLTMRAVMSNNNAEFALRITDEDGEVITEYHAYGEIVIPVVQLYGRDLNGLDFYVIEAQLLRKTWTLTAEELEIVNILRYKVLEAQSVYNLETQKEKKSQSSTTSTRRRRVRTPQRQPSSTKQPTPDFIENAPHWRLMIVVDQELSSTVTIEKDVRRWEQIQQMKTQWELANPGRYQRSCQIRQAFLNHDIYSSYVHNYLLEHGVGRGEKTGCLLQHLSFRETDTYELYCPSDRQDTSKNQMEEFDFEYNGIRRKFSGIRLKQLRDHILTQKHILKVSDISRTMINEAYLKRDTIVERLMEQLTVQKSTEMKKTTSKKSTK